MKKGREKTQKETRGPVRKAHSRRALAFSPWAALSPFCPVSSWPWSASSLAVLCEERDTLIPNKSIGGYYPLCEIQRM
ncbi:hypothetical protein M0657_007570 [Pyricularia oryzae]|nr:hypothetical protein M9X92_010609 [Pyricularia oryzae]KAI7918449.1 hypothetical protein M0657_007570 [Pyricularia oryzae]